MGRGRDHEYRRARGRRPRGIDNERKEAKTRRATRTARTVIMREEDDVGPSGGRDREKLSGYAGVRDGLRGRVEERHVARE